MRQFASDIAFTPAVKGIQIDKGSRSSYARMEMGGSWETTITPELQGFLADLDMFYLGTANALGQPYIQYCPQHIHKRFTQKQIAPVIEQLQARIAELESRLKPG